MFAAFDASCFEGGYHAKLLGRKMSQLSPEKQYIYGIGAVSDVVTYSLLSPDAIDFDSFFNEIRFLENKTSKEKEILLPIATLNIRATMPDYTEYTATSHLPIFFIPGDMSYSFKTYFTNENIKLIDKDKESPFQLSSNDTALLLATENLNTPISLNLVDATHRLPTLVSMLPGDTTHNIAKISTNAELTKLLQDTFFGLQESCHKSFFIKQLSCINDQNSGIVSVTGQHELCDVFITKNMVNTLWGSFNHRTYVYGTIHCKFEGKHYKANITAFSNPSAKNKSQARIFSISKFTQVSEEEFKLAISQQPLPSTKQKICGWFGKKFESIFSVNLDNLTL
jgi:hypothetical protein